MIDKIKQYDIMQHIKNIYQILGYESIDGIVQDKPISEILAEVQATGKDIWVGTEAKYTEGRGNGTIPDNVICLITDDYISPVAGTRAD